MVKYHFQLKNLRYSTLFRSVILIDLAVVTILWIVGGALSLNEMDQIIKFNYLSSVFDIIVVTSLKSVVLFILITELETITKDFIFSIRKEIKAIGKQDGSENDAANDDDSLTTFNDDQRSILNERYSREGPEHLRYLKSILHLSILLITIVSSVYSVVKFSFVINSFIKEDKMPLDALFFSIIVISGCFSLIQLVFSSLSWLFMKKFTTIELNKTSDEEERNKTPKKVNLKRLLSLAKPEIQPLFYGFIALLISSVTTIVTPYFFGKVIDSAERFESLTEMNYAVLTMFFIYVGGSVASGIRSWLFEFAGQRVVARLRRHIFNAIIRQDIKFFDSNRTGELTSRISSDTQVLQSAVTVNISMLLRYIIQIIGSIIFMFTLQPGLTGLLLAVIPVVSLAAVQYGRYLRVLRKEFQDNLATASVTAEESISSTRTVRSFSAENKMSKNYEKDIDKSFKVGVKLAVAGGGFMFFVGILTAGALSLVLWYGGKLVHEKQLSTGVLASFLMFTLQVAMAFAFLMSLYSDFQQAVGASQRIFEILDTKTDIPLNTGLPLDLNDDTFFDGSVQLNNVTFAYPTRNETNVLNELTFSIEKGKTCALVGPSGGGKSTIFSLIERFYDSNSGSIMIGPNNTDLKNVNLSYLHTKIAMVSQEPVLFGGSIKENISFGRPDEVDMNEIIEAAKLANAHSFITTFEKGYDTIVGERGVRLSGGQKQRIAIARALLVNPKLLLLDEATSALDSESEHLVQEAMNVAMQGRTVCVIAHRLSTVRNADTVIVLDGGKIVEKGSHDELIALNGVYKQLVLRQMLSKD